MTYEDAKRVRKDPITEDCDYRELAKLIDDAVDKQIPTPPIRIDSGIRWHLDGSHYYYDGCPVCKCEVGLQDNYCRECGQRVR